MSMDKEMKDLEQIVLHGLEIESIEKEKAAERKALTRKNGIKPEDAKYLQSLQGQTRDIVAEKLGISGKHWEHMKFVYHHKDSLSEQEYLDWKCGKVSTSKLYNQLCKMFKYTEVINSIVEDMLQMEDDILKFERSYTDIDFKHKLSSAIFNCKEETKNTLNSSFEKIMEEKRDFAADQWSKMVSLRRSLELFRDYIQRK